MSELQESEPTPKAAAAVGTTGLVGVGVHCCECRHWKQADERTRKLYPFAKRLSEREGRMVAIGYCYQRHPEGSGPTADHDWCEHAKKTPTAKLSLGTD